MKKTTSMLLATLVAVGALLCAGRDSSPAGKSVSVPSGTVEVVRDGEYCSKGEVAEYIRRFGGALPKNYITKAQARALGWHGGPLEPFAPGKSIGGDRFGNYERRLPPGNYKECDIDAKGRPRGAKRLIFTARGERIYYTQDHYKTFEEIKEKKK
jgi:guanyl-specific ribonuclease Sa